MRLHCSDILDFPAEALLLTIDGAASGMEGNVAQQFGRRWPEDWSEMRRHIKYPVPLGRTLAMAWEGDAPWRLYLFASTLHHADILTVDQKRAVAKSALAEAIRLCVRYKARTLASPLLTGGWRLDPQEAGDLMAEPSIHSLATNCGVALHVFDRSASPLGSE